MPRVRSLVPVLYALWLLLRSDGWQKATPFNWQIIINKTFVIINH